MWCMRKSLRRNESAKRKFTHKTFIKRMVLMRNFGLTSVFMMALFFGK